MSQEEEFTNVVQDEQQLLAEAQRLPRGGTRHGGRRGVHASQQVMSEDVLDLGNGRDDDREDGVAGGGVGDGTNGPARQLGQLDRYQGDVSGEGTDFNHFFVTTCLKIYAKIDFGVIGATRVTPA